MNYLEYINSWRWKSNPARTKEIASAGKRCRICAAEGSSKEPLEAHHATYERLGSEIDGDLLAVCRPCHLEITSFLRRRRYSLRRVTRADVIPQRDRRTRLFDPTVREIVR